MTQVLHKHHIIPRHIGGTDDPSNLIELTVAEHAEAHRLLYEKYGRDEDRLAWKGLSGLIGKDEMIREKASLNSSRPGKSNPFYGKTHSEETKQKISKKKKGHSYNKGIPKSEEHKAKLSKLRKENATKYTFEHLNGQYFIGTTVDLSKITESHPTEVWKLAVGKYKTHKGWKLVDKTLLS
jgi:hypothetical protein